MKVLVKNVFGMSAPNTTSLIKKEESGKCVSFAKEEKECLKQSYAITMSNICVREGHSKESKVLTTLGYGTIVFVLETKGNRAKICFCGQEVGWCTIYFEKEQRFLLFPCTNQNKGKILFDAQDIDPVDLYEQEYDDYEHLFPYCENVKMSKLKTKRQKSKDFKRLQQDPPAGVSGAPSDNNIMLWNAVIFGPHDTPFEDGTFKLTIEFTEEYPNKPPTVRFVSKMFHPNVYAGE